MGKGGEQIDTGKDRATDKEGDRDLENETKPEAQRQRERQKDRERNSHRETRCFSGQGIARRIPRDGGLSSGGRQTHNDVCPSGRPRAGWRNMNIFPF